MDSLFNFGLQVKINSFLRDEQEETTQHFPGQGFTVRAGSFAHRVPSSRALPSQGRAQPVPVPRGTRTVLALTQSLLVRHCLAGQAEEQRPEPLTALEQSLGKHCTAEPPHTPVCATPARDAPSSTGRKKSIYLQAVLVSWG